MMEYVETGRGFNLKPEEMYFPSWSKMMMEEQKGKRRRLMENSEGTIMLEMNSEGELRPRIMRASEHMQNPRASLRIMSRGIQASQSSVSLILQSCALFRLGL